MNYKRRLALEFLYDKYVNGDESLCSLCRFVDDCSVQCAYSVQADINGRLNIKEREMEMLNRIIREDILIGISEVLFK